MQIIVSRNFRNRDSKNKWLMRRANQAPDQAIPVREVNLGNFVFGPSTATESGFGCGTVAKGEITEEAAQDYGLAAVSLQFDGIHSFYIDGQRSYSNRVEEGKVLSLRADGTIQAVQNGKTPIPVPAPVAVSAPNTVRVKRDNRGRFVRF